MSRAFYLIDFESNRIGCCPDLLCKGRELFESSIDLSPINTKNISSMLSNRLTITLSLARAIPQCPFYDSITSPLSKCRLAAFLGSVSNCGGDPCEHLLFGVKLTITYLSKHLNWKYAASLSLSTLCSPITKLCLLCQLASSFPSTISCRGHVADTSGQANGPDAFEPFG
jgi:hypothetical protein